MAENEKVSPIPVWHGPSYPRVNPGIYFAKAIRVQGPEWVHRFSRWSLLMEFEILGQPEALRLAAFFNMGRRREQPTVGRHSNYFKAWTLSNGGLPHTNQEMTPDVFLRGQLYEVEIRDSEKDDGEQQKTESNIYSVVKGIISVIKPEEAFVDWSITNHEARIKNDRIQ